MELRRSLAFTTLILFQLFNTLNARSSVYSAFRGFFRNRWLWGTIALSIGLQLLILNVPLLQRALSATPLATGLWLRCTIVASSVLWVAEVEKYIRRYWLKRRATEIA